MYSELYQYLILQHQLQIPGIGTFRINREPSQLDFPNRVIKSPAYRIHLQSSGDSNSRHLYNWLSQLLQIPEREAVVRFNDFAFEMKKKLVSGTRIHWQGVGSLSKDLSGAIQLESTPVQFAFEKSVAAEKVLREKAEHIVRVGEDERTSSEMTGILAQHEVKKSQWWAYALAVAIIAVIFIGWYLFRHGMDVNSISPNSVLKAGESSSTYRYLDNP